MGNVGSHLSTADLSIDDLENIVYPTSRSFKSEIPEFVEPAVNYELAERLGKLGELKKPIDKLHDQIRFTQNEHAKLMLRKYIHRELFTSTQFDRSIPLDLYFPEEYIVHRDCYSGRLNYSRLYPESTTKPQQQQSASNLDDEHAMRAFNIFASRSRLEASNKSTTNSSLTTSIASESTRPSLEEIEDNKPLVVVRKRQSKTDLHNAEGTGALRRVPSDTCIQQQKSINTNMQLRRQRSKSVDHGRFKGKFKFKSPPPTHEATEPAVPKITGDFFSAEYPPRLHLPPDSIDRASSVSPTKEFDFLLGNRNSPPKPNRMHHTQPQQLFSHRAQPQSEYRQYHGRAHYSPRLNNECNGFSEAEMPGQRRAAPPPVTAVVVGAASHWSLSDVAAEPAAPPPEGMINAGIPPRVPPHSAVSTLSHSRSAQVSGTAGYAGNQNAMPMASVSLSSATVTDGAARGCENCGAKNHAANTGSRPSSRQAIITTEPLKLDSNVYTRKCSFKKRASWVSQKFGDDENENENNDDDDDDDDEALARRLSQSRHTFILDGYESKKKLHVVNRSTDRISVVSNSTVPPPPPPSLPAHHHHQLSTASSRTQLMDSAPQLDHDSATSEQDDDEEDEWMDQSSLMQSPKQTFDNPKQPPAHNRQASSTEFCQYFGLEMFSDKVVTRAQLRSSWETRGQRFLARYD